MVAYSYVKNSAIYVALILLFACSLSKKEPKIKVRIQGDTITPTISVKDSLEQIHIDSINHSLLLIDSAWHVYESAHDSAIVNLSLLDTTIVYDIRYATTNNILEYAAYPCGYCYTRKGVAKVLMHIQDSLQKEGLGLKIFDAYRPLSIQFKLWEQKPDRRYVANPNEGASMHNRGGAVDLTLVDIYGKELDMGTDFDHFGKEAHWAYTAFGEKSKDIINNRNALRDLMSAYGFTTINSEWWHYAYRVRYFHILDESFQCPN